MARGTTSTGGGSKFGALAGARQIASLVRGMSIEAIEEAVRQPPQMLFVSNDSNAAEIAGDLTGVRGTPSVQTTTLDNLPRDLEQFDVIVVHNPATNADFVRIRQAAGRNGHLVFDTGPNIDPESHDALRTRISEGVGDGAVAIGRWYPAFRSAATNAVISDTSRTNAQFALVANVPAVIPVIGSLVSAGADMIILTKNQLTMAIKIAAIHGKPLSDRKAIFRDLTPVIGAGFIWRTLAREGASFLPLAAGTIPKVAVAYSGTFAIGKAIDTYYRIGKAPTDNQIIEYYKKGLTAVKSRFRPSDQPAITEVSIIPPD